MVSSWILGALITGTFVSHVYFPMLSQHWTHANVIETTLSNAVREKISSLIR